MAEKELLSVTNKDSLGKIEIAPEVIEVITGLAVAEVDGISMARGSFAERFGKKYSQGVKVDLENGGVMIDLYIVLKYGESIPKVAEKIQTNVKQTLRNMAELEVKEVNIHVMDLEMETEE
ncbi:MAG TPA: Asp23/Gls24 family envelope stress response protein [Bacillota bacterium]|nr:Asp23/Gls24 family envelope stress response protein [Bacillota bacterium]